MSDDIRLQSDWYQNPKIKKLGMMIGPQGIVSLLTLWAWTGKNRSKGLLHDMDEFDIALAANWPNEASTFIETLLKLKLLDQADAGYSIHDWSGNQPWATHSDSRKEAARKAAEARWKKERGNGKVSTSCATHENGCDSHDPECGSHESALRSASFFDAPIPSPSPIPNPSLNTSQDNPPTPRKRGDSSRGTRWSDDRKVPQEWKDWAKETYPSVDADKEALKFENYWAAKAGANAVKVSWEKTWKGWILKNEQSFSQSQPYKQGTYNANRKHTIADDNAREAALMRNLAQQRIERERNGPDEYIATPYQAQQNQRTARNF